MAATVEVRLGTGASVAWQPSTEAGMKWNRVDTLTGNTPIPIPTSTGTNYSWIKSLALYVTSGGGSTTLSNLQINYASAPATGLTFDWKAVAVASYVQATSGSKPTDGTSTDADVPAGYTAMTGTAAQYDATGGAATNSAPCGLMAVCVAGVGSNYAGGAGSANASPDLTFTYDEA